MVRRRQDFFPVFSAPSATTQEATTLSQTAQPREARRLLLVLVLARRLETRRRSPRRSTRLIVATLHEKILRSDTHWIAVSLTGVSLSLSLLLTKVTHAQYRKRFRVSYNESYSPMKCRSHQFVKWSAYEIFQDYDIKEYRPFPGNQQDEWRHTCRLPVRNWEPMQEEANRDITVVDCQWETKNSCKQEEVNLFRIFGVPSFFLCEYSLCTFLFYFYLFIYFLLDAVALTLDTMCLVERDIGSIATTWAVWEVLKRTVEHSTSEGWCGGRTWKQFYGRSLANGVKSR